MLIQPAVIEAVLRAPESSAAARLPKPAGVVRAERALSGPDLAVHMLGVQLPPTDAARALREPQRLAQLGHDLLFLANPDTQDSRKWDPSYQRWDARTQS